MSELTDPGTLAGLAAFTVVLIRELKTFHGKGAAKERACESRAVVLEHEGREMSLRERDQLVLTEMTESLRASSELTRGASATLQAYLASWQAWQAEQRTFQRDVLDAVGATRKDLAVLQAQTDRRSRAR